MKLYVPLTSLFYESSLDLTVKRLPKAKRSLIAQWYAGAYWMSLGLWGLHITLAYRLKGTQYPDRFSVIGWDGTV